MQRLQIAFSMMFLGACSLVNNPADHQAGDAGGGADVTLVDARVTDDTGRDAGPMADAGPDAGPMEDTGPDVGPMEDAGPDVGPMEDAGPPTVSADEYCMRIAELLCTANASCCEDRDEPFPDCEDVLRQECADVHGPNPVLPSTLEFDGVRAAQALVTLEPLTTDCDTDVVNWRLDDFMSPLRGQRGRLNEECTPRAFSTAREIVHETFSCDRDSEPNAICQPATKNRWQCEVRREDGRGCYLGPQCLSGRCEPNAFLPAVGIGTCGDGLAVGEVCQPERPDQCQSLVCEDTGPDWRCMERTQEKVYCGAN